ncbi:MAG: ferredoxin [Paracoccaceae bacterium]
MSGLSKIAARAAESGLAVLGGFHPGEGDAAPQGCATLLLFGPSGHGMWDSFTASREFSDGEPHPLDRWSKRTLDALASACGGAAVFPSDRPYPPFISWAMKTGRCWQSPVGLLVHDTEGLLVSFRGALALPERLALPEPRAGRPCEGCPQRPCLTACPVSALGAGSYDTRACHGHLASGNGEDCMTRGCSVRLACPVGRGGRPAAQHAFHMRAFHRTGTGNHRRER